MNNNDFVFSQDGTYPQHIANPQAFQFPAPSEKVQILAPTTFNELQGYAVGNVVRLPDFSEGQPLIARLKRPSLLALTASKKIPNTLLTAASELFNGSGKIDADNENALTDLYKVCRIICESSLIQPTLNEIEKAGLELTDEQMIAIFNYSQQGVKALEPFRQK